MIKCKVLRKPRRKVKLSNLDDILPSDYSEKQEASVYEGGTWFTCYITYNILKDAIAIYVGKDDEIGRKIIIVENAFEEELVIDYEENVLTQIKSMLVDLKTRFFNSREDLEEND